MITQFEHKFNIGDTVFLTFYSRGQYRVRKKTGYKIKIIRFNLSTPFPYAVQPENKEEKSVYYWFEGKNPSVSMASEYACFASLEDAYSSDKKPENGSYILGNQNHIGRYFKGYVYYWAFDCQKGYPRRAKLKNWCDAWLYLKPCCLASEKEYRDTMGVVRPFEPCEYEEFNIID